MKAELIRKSGLLALVGAGLFSTSLHAQQLRLNDKDYLETRGVNVMVYSNPFSPAFYDEKRSGIDIIHHGVMTVGNGGVRLSDTPEQWDLVPVLKGREINKATGEFTVKLYYQEYDYTTEIRVKPAGKGFTIAVHQDAPIPAKLEGKAGFNLELLPTVYWNRSYLADGKPHYFPRSVANDTELRPLADKTVQINDLITADLRGRKEFAIAKPMAEANKLVIAPEDPQHMITVTSDSKVSLFDGRVLAQNGWFVLRSLLPAKKTGKVLEWTVTPNSVSNWMREPVVGFSQVGYTPEQKKEAIIELDINDTQKQVLNVYRVNADGTTTLAKAASVEAWGQYTRYNYAKADFSDVKTPGIYFLEYGNQRTNTFPIDVDVYDKVYYPSLDTWMPVAMDHMTVKEAYRVWHGAPHLDDVVQAPLNIPHFDMFQMGNESFSPYKDYEFIEGFDAGGFFDAGDFDIEGPAHASTILSLATLWTELNVTRDETMIDQKNKFVNIHFPDGTPDVLQLLEHGVLPIVNMVEKIGHACRGINHPTLYQYNRLDEPSTITDNIRGTGDERWLFTYHDNGLDVRTLVGLAATAQALKDYNPQLSERCLKAAQKIWADSQGFKRAMLLQPALQLFLATGDKEYLKNFEKDILAELKAGYVPGGKHDWSLLTVAIQAAPYMSKKFVEKLRPYVLQYRVQLDDMLKDNPYGVQAYGGGWGSNSQIVQQGTNCYYANQLFPEIITKEDVLRSANFLFGCHPDHNKSFVLGVGMHTKNMAYGNNRSDYSFIPGCVVPGLMMLQPDYLENKDDWPFYWGQNEGTVAQNVGYIVYANMIKKMLGR